MGAFTGAVTLPGLMRPVRPPSQDPTEAPKLSRASLRWALLAETMSRGELWDGEVGARSDMVKGDVWLSG